MNIRACCTVLVLSFLSTGYVSAQKAWWQWVNVEEDDTVPAMDVSGVYVKDSQEIFFYGKMQGAGQHAVTAYSPDGKIRRHILKTQGDVNPTEVLVNEWGHIIVAGYIRDQVLIDTLSYNAPPPFDSQSFITILDSSGMLKSISVFGYNGSPDNISSMTVHKDAIYLTGGSSEGDGVSSGPGKQDFYIARYDTMARRVWIRYSQTLFYSSGTSVTTDDSGNVYAAGTFADSIIFLPDSVKLISKGDRDIFITKYDSSGKLIWVKHYGSVSMDYILRLRQWKDFELILLAGFPDSVNIDGFVMKPDMHGHSVFLYLDTAGNILNARRQIENPSDFVVGSNDIIYATGSLNDTAFMDTIVASHGQNDGYIGILNTDGQFSYVVNYGTKSMDPPGRLACDNNMNVYLAGDVNGNSGPDTAYFGPFSSYVSTWNIDFIAKITFDQTLYLHDYLTMRPSVIKIFPNPAASGSINITFAAAVSPHESTLTIYNCLGRRVAEYRLRDAAVSHTIQLPRLDSGVYIVRLSTPEGIATGKLIVQ